MDAEYEIEKYSDSIDDYTKHLASYSDDAGAFNNRGLCKGKLKEYLNRFIDLYAHKQELMLVN